MLPSVSHQSGVAPANHDQTNGRERARAAVNRIMTAKDEGTATAARVEAILSELQPGDLSPSGIVFAMTRVQNTPWTMADFNDDARFEAKAGGDLVIARALRARLPGHAPEPQSERVHYPTIDAPSTSVAAPAPGPVPAPPTSARPSMPPLIPPETDPRYMVDPASAALLGLHAECESADVDSHQVALDLQAHFDALFREENTMNERDVTRMREGLSPAERAYQDRFFGAPQRRN